MSINSCYSINFDTPAWNALFAEGKKKNYRAGNLICMQDEISTELLYISSGIVKHSCFLPNGAEKILAYETAPLLFGSPSAYVNDPTPITTYAITNLTGISIPIEIARSYFDKYNELNTAIIISLSKKLAALSKHAKGYYLTVPKRLAEFLYNTSKYGILCGNEYSDKPFLHQEDIASIIGSTRPRVSHYLNEFKKNGYIKIENGIITVLSKELLAEYIDND